MHRMCSKLQLIFMSQSATFVISPISNDHIAHPAVERETLVSLMILIIQLYLSLQIDHQVLMLTSIVYFKSIVSTNTALVLYIIFQ